MTRKFGQILFLSLLTFAFLTGSAFAEDAKATMKNATLDDVLETIEQHPTLPHGSFRTWPADKNMGGDDAGPGETNAYFGDAPRDLGFDQRGVVDPGPGVGLTMGYTTYDYQHNCRTTRQVAWRTTPDVHVAWMKKNNAVPQIGSGVRLTTYSMWDAVTGALKWPSEGLYFGGDDLHSTTERSGYCGLDVMSDGRGVPYNHYDDDGLSPYVYVPMVWPDNSAGAGMWGYKQGAPEDQREPDWANDDGQWAWPYGTFQLYDNGTVEDTIFHIVASESGNISNLVHRYFRRLGGPHPGVDPTWRPWTSMTFDSGQVISPIVEAAPPEMATGYEDYRGKVAIVWTAYFGADLTPGNPESGHLEPISLALEQNAQDMYMMTSNDGGVTWDGGNTPQDPPVLVKYNITKNDIQSMDLNWWPLGDISAVIDTWGRLHVVWAARPHRNLTGALGTVIDPQMDYPLYPLGSRIYHFSDEGEVTGSALEDNFITPVRDAMGDWSEMDSICTGGAWHGMALNLPSIGQCDDKLYVSFSQFQDVKAGVWDNCHMSAWTNNIPVGSANANIYFSVSTMTNGGLNWDPARLLTGLTQRCDTAETGNPGVPVDGDVVCHSHFYNSMSRWGMNINSGTGVGGNFTNAIVVSPEEDPWDIVSTDYYMDVFYIDDLWPGGLVQGEGMWTVNPVKWFRFPCVEPVEASQLAYEPAGIFEATPSWSKPGDETTIDVTMSNIGNIPLSVTNIVVEEIDNADPLYDGWLSIDERGFDGNITAVVPFNSFDIGVIINTGSIINETAVLEGKVTFTWDGLLGDEVDVLNIGYIIADTVQQYEQDTLFTQTTGITVANNGNYGGGLFDTCGRMDFHIQGYLGRECDTCRQSGGNAEYKYLAGGAPFVVREIDGGEARLSTSIAGHGLYSEIPDTEIRDGFRPQEGQPEKHTNAAFCHWIESGEFVTADSAVRMKNQLIAPLTESPTDTSDFFVLITKFWNNTDSPISDMFVGTIEDWDIPTDSLTRNTSGADVNRKLMYMSGWECHQPDTLWCDTAVGALHQNLCTDSDDRYGGSAFFGGHQWKSTGIKTWDKYDEVWGSFSFKLANWLGADVRQHVPARRMYDTLMSDFYGYNPWTCSPDDPDNCEAAESIYQDLGMITAYGQFTLGVTDTITFIKFLASEYDGGLVELQNTIDEAKAFTLYYLCCDIWGLPGDADTDSKVNILDIVWMINFKYKEGPGVKWPSSVYLPEGEWDDVEEEWITYPTDNCDDLMNVDDHAVLPSGLGKINILDIVYLINYKYKEGPAPTCPRTFYE